MASAENPRLLTTAWRKLLPHLPASFRLRLDIAQAENRVSELYRDTRGADEESGEVDHILRMAAVEENWLSVLRTRAYRAKAKRYDIGFPTDPALFDKMEWDWDPAETQYLTDAGMQVVRDLIRAEQKHRREVAGFWLTAVTGAAGTLIGLISVLKDAF